MKTLSLIFGMVRILYSPMACSLLKVQPGCSLRVTSYIQGFDWLFDLPCPSYLWLQLEEFSSSKSS